MIDLITLTKWMEIKQANIDTLQTYLDEHPDMPYVVFRAIKRAKINDADSLHRAIMDMERRKLDSEDQS